MTLVLLVGCGPRLDGTYELESMGRRGMVTYTFKGDKVVIGGMGIKSEHTYKIEDKSVKIETPMGVMILDIMEDGSLKAPMAGKLVKSKD